MEIKYITIEREYGSGGTEIAEKVAQMCNINCYGKEILEIAATNLHISVEEAQQYEEQGTNSFLHSMYVMSQSQTGVNGPLPIESKLYIEEHNAILALARKGKAIFVGHCASEALEKEEGVLRVFIRAEENFKTNRIINEYGIEASDAVAVCRKFNKKRANYYTFNTSRKWDDLNNYDIVLDSSRIGIEGCAKALAAMLKESC